MGFLSSMRKASQERNLLNFDLEDLILPHKSIVVKLPVSNHNFKEPPLSKGIYTSRVVESIIVYLLMLSFFLENGHSECACTVNTILIPSVFKFLSFKSYHVLVICSCWLIEV